jgi:uncharacterized damage-inducible protein DinB
MHRLRVLPQTSFVTNTNFVTNTRREEMVISEGVKEAWQINEGMNKVLLEYLTPDMLTVQTPDKSRTVARYLAHIAATKKWWGTQLNEEQVDSLPNLYDETTGKVTFETNLARIKDVFEQTNKTILETAERADTKGKLPYPSIDVYLIHQMVHDAHHRGQILLALRTAGHTPPSDDDFWGGWWTDQAL